VVKEKGRVYEDRHESSDGEGGMNGEKIGVWTPGSGEGGRRWGHEGQTTQSAAQDIKTTTGFHLAMNSASVRRKGSRAGRVRVSSRQEVSSSDHATIQARDDLPTQQQYIRRKLCWCC